ncbi:3-deoxy-D-manno-octulosonic acid transferase [Verrucomicrobiota bacterium]
MLWLLYNVLFAVGYTLMLPRFLARMWRRGGYGKGFSERFALYPSELAGRIRPGERIWIHAVSVGEVLVALRFMRGMKEAQPGTGFILTTTTSTGRCVAAARIADDDVLLYFPVDFPWIVKRALSRLRPRALLLTESEIWPNLVRLAHAGGIPVILINGRISESSHRGYRAARPFFSRVLRCMDLLLVQTPGDRDRLTSLGADPERVHVLGTAKYDVAERDPEEQEDAEAVLRTAGVSSDCPVIVGGSTWPGEEAALLDAYRGLRRAIPALKLVLVPRHAERAGEVAAEIERAGLVHVLRSGLQPGSAAKTGADVLLVDTTGELKRFYSCATVIFVGRSLTRHGGQNIIEPALFGKPVIVGPNMENFPVVAADFLSAGAMVQVGSAAELTAALESFLSDEGKRMEYGARAAAVVREKKGAVRESLRLIAAVMGPDRA